MAKKRILEKAVITGRMMYLTPDEKMVWENLQILVTIVDDNRHRIGLANSPEQLQNNLDLKEIPQDTVVDTIDRLIAAGILVHIKDTSKRQRAVETYELSVNPSEIVVIEIPERPVIEQYRREKHELFKKIIKEVESGNFQVPFPRWVEERHGVRPGSTMQHKLAYNYPDKKKVGWGILKRNADNTYIVCIPGFERIKLTLKKKEQYAGDVLSVSVLTVLAQTLMHNGRGKRFNIADADNNELETAQKLLSEILGPISDELAIRKKAEEITAELEKISAQREELESKASELLEAKRKLLRRK